MSESGQEPTEKVWSLNGFLSGLKKATTEVSKIATEIVDRSATGAIKLYGEIKSKGEDMINEINAKESALNQNDEVVLPWLLPEFINSSLYQRMVKTDILLLSKDINTFLTSFDGSESETYSLTKNSKLIVLLRQQDKRLQKARFALVQRDALVDDDHFWRNYIYRVLQIVNNYKKLISSENDNSSNINKPNDNSSIVNQKENISSSFTAADVAEINIAETKAELSTIDTSPEQATKSTVPTSVQTLDDIYDFDNISDIEEDDGDIEFNDEDLNDLDLESEILSQL